MTKDMIIQGRHLQQTDIEFLQRLIVDNPSWTRTYLSKQVCIHWEWRRENGQLKDIAWRSMLRKLDVYDSKKSNKMS